MAFLGLQTFAYNLTGVARLLRLDNVTAITYLNQMGGAHSGLLSRLAIEVWNWCLQRNVIIHAEHLPGRENICDWESHHMSDSSDWMLDLGVFRTLYENFGQLSINLFAAQLEVYCSWRPDLMPWAIDALSVMWKGLNLYMIPHLH